MSPSSDYVFGRVERNTAEIAANTARLNTINGQIERMADGVERLAQHHADLRVDVEKGNAALAVEVAKVKTKAGMMAAIGAGLATCIFAPLTIVVVIKAFGLTAHPVGRTGTPPASKTAPAGARQGTRPASSERAAYAALRAR